MSPAKQRYCRHYLSLFQRLGAEYRRGGSFAEQAVRAFDVDRAQITRAFQSASASAHTSNDAAFMCIALVRDSAELMFCRTSARQRMHWVAVAIRWSSRLDVDQDLVHLLGYAGLIRIHQGRPQTALRLFRKQRRLADDRGDQVALADALGNEGVVLKNLKRYDDAIAIYYEQLRVAGALEDDLIKGRAIGNLAVALRYKGHHAESLELLSQRYAIAERLGDTAGLGNCLLNSGITLRWLGRHDEALDRLRAASRQFGRVKDDLGMGRCIAEIGTIHAALGDPLTARVCYRRALTFFDATGSVRDQLECTQRLREIPAEAQVSQEMTTSGSGTSIARR